MDRTEALSQRDALEQRYSELLERIKKADLPGERSRLLRDLDETVGERLALEGDHAEEFWTVDAEAVQQAQIHPGVFLAREPVTGYCPN